MRAWDHTTEERKCQLRTLFALNGRLSRGYQAMEQLRKVLRSATRETMEQGWHAVLRRTARRDDKPLRTLHDSLRYDEMEVLALVEHRPPTGPGWRR